MRGEGLFCGFQGIKEGAERARKIVRDLRVFARSEDDVWQPVDLHGEIDSSLTLLNHLLKDRIAVERMRYSEAVRDYNTRIRLFPGSLVASLRGFKEKAYFEATPGSQEPPKVKF